MLWCTEYEVGKRSSVFKPFDYQFYVPESSFNLSKLQFPHLYNRKLIQYRNRVRIKVKLNVYTDTHILGMSLLFCYQPTIVLYIEFQFAGRCGKMNVPIF